MAHLWDVASGQLETTLQNPPGLDARTVAMRVMAPVRQEEAALLVNDSSAQWRAILKIHTGRVDEHAFSPDRATLATTQFGQPEVSLRDVVRRRLKAILQGHSSGYKRLAFSPDGKTLQIATFGTTGEVTVQPWDDGGKKCKPARKGTSPGFDEEWQDNYSLTISCYSPDDKWLAVGTGVQMENMGFACGAELWYVADVGQGKFGSPGVCGLAFSPDGRMLATQHGQVTCGGDRDQIAELNTVRLWSLPDSAKEEAANRAFKRLIERRQG
jgi:WD40 repeat protein